jgi:hypothetical protein
VIPLLCALLIFAAAILYVFSVPGQLTSGPEKTRATFLRERKEAVYENLRDLNFEFKAGKLPEKDYQAMKGSLEEEAAAILSEIASLESGAPPTKAILRKKGQKI